MRSGDRALLSDRPPNGTAFLPRGMIMNAAGERSKQDRFLGNRPVSSNLVFGGARTTP